MNKNTISKIMFTAAAALALAACCKEKGLENIPVELRLTSSLYTQLNEGGAVHMWVDDASTGEPLYSNTVLTAGSDGALRGGPMYFPSSGNSADIFAIHGNFGTADLTNFWGTEQTHTVAQDQRASSGGYAQSDLVFAKSTNVGPAGNPTTVPLTFTRLLSKVEVVLVDDVDSYNVSKIEILNTRLEATYTPSKTDGFSLSASGTTGENPIETDVFTTTVADAEGADEGKKALNEAVIVPQTLKKDTDFIRVTTTDGEKPVYKLPADKTFESGKKYRFTIKVNLDRSLEVTAETSGWTDFDSTIGEAENPITLPAGDKSVTQAAVGDYYMADGSILDRGNTLTQELASKIIGIVFYVGQHESDNSDYSDTGIGQAECHGYVVALTDANNDLSDRVLWVRGPDGLYNLVVGDPTSDEVWNGYYYSPKFHEYVNAHSYDSWEMKHFQAANACESYGNRTVDRDGNPTDAYEWQKPLVAPENSSGWFLPANGQLKYLYVNREFISPLIDNVKNKLPEDCSYKGYVKWFNSAIDFEDYYWSCSENPLNRNSAWIMNFNEGELLPFRKEIKSYVRAVLAF